ncbi:MAG: NUDIX domain-containing protein [Lactimicrobium massiliense]|nr:NUDIX domain-containing protein [Lactimicrobium massiliense]MDD6725859.1 NUDIX domain-containing protein [Lactimicrobium massiliense]
MPTALYYLHDPFAPDPNCPTRFGSALVICAKGKILLEQRADNFRWGIVSGDLHDTETFRDCAIRQAIKETGIHLYHDQLNELKVFDDPSRIVSFLDGNIYRIVSFAFFTDLDEIPETTVGKGSIELRWVDPQDLPDYQFAITHQEILEYYLLKKNLQVTLPQRSFLQ